MTKPAFALVACLAAVTGFTAGTAQAQGMRLPGTTTPAFTLSAPTATTSAVNRQADYIVAVVNSEPVTNNEVLARLLRVQQQMSQQGQPIPPRQVLLSQVLDRVISERTQVQYARELGLKVDDAQVDQAEQSVAAQNQLEVSELRRRIVADGLDPKQFRDDLRNQMLVQRLRERDFEPRVKVSDLEADQYAIEQRANADPSKVEVNIAQILIAVPDNATPAQVTELQAKAQKAYERARAGEDFGKLAAELSNGPEASRAGQLGLRTMDRYPDLFVSTVQPLTVGGVAAPVRSGAGFHVLKLVEKHQADGIDGTITETHARHILLRTSPQLTQAQAIEQLAGYKRRIEASQAKFDDLARQFSQDGSAREGGDLGWSRPNQFVPEFEEALDRLQPGQISDPVVSRFGVHLMQLLERREAKLTQRELRELARNQLRQKKLDEAYSNWAQEVRGRAYVEMREAPQ